MNAENLLSVIPEKWRGTVLLLIAVSPYITRAFHALVNGRGLRGVLSAIWLGTNTPAPTALPQDKRQIPLLLPLLTACAACMLAGCAVTSIRQRETAKDGTERTTTFRGMTFFDSGASLAKARTTMTEKSQGIGLTGYESEASGSNVVSLTERVAGAVVSAAIQAAK